MRQKLRRFNRRLTTSRRRHTRRLRILSRHPFMVPIVVFLCLAALTTGGLWWLFSRGISLTPSPTDIVLISHDHYVQVVPSHEATVGALLAKLHIPINQGDTVEPALNTAIHQDDFRINVYRALPVRIVDGTTTSFVYSAAATPRSMAQQAGLTIYPQDALVTEPTTNILQKRAIGSLVIVNRSLPITLNLNGYSVPTRTQAKTVKAFLVEKHIQVTPDDTVTPDLSSAIAANATISIIHNGISVQNVNAVIPTPVQYISDPNLAYGTYAIRQAGSPGQQILTYRVTVQHGQVVDRTLIQTVVTVPPVPQIIVQGSNLSGIKGDMALAGISPSDYQYADYIISHESGWCPTKAQGEHYCPAIPDNQYTPNGYGLCQATPGYKMQTAGSDWATNPVTQLIWCNGYAVQRYGGWYQAYSHWVSYHNW